MELATTSGLLNQKVSRAFKGIQGQLKCSRRIEVLAV
jgi:hypothetical protein